MTDKQLAVILRTYHRELANIYDTLRDKLVEIDQLKVTKDSLFGKYDNVPVLDHLGRLVDNIQEDIGELRAVEDDTRRD